MIMPGSLRIHLFLAALVGATGCNCRDQGAAKRVEVSGIEAFYALDTLPTLSLTLDQDAVESLKDDPRDFTRGSLSYQGTVYRDVGVRLKGHRSMRPIDDKPSFKIRFDKHVQGQRFLGQRDLVLNNLVEDPTMMREILGYRLYRAMGVPAPDVAYARVEVNGQPYGLYSIIESVDEHFLARRFDDSSGGLYEGEYGCDLHEDDVEGFDRDSGSKDTRAALRALTAAAAGPASGLIGRERGLLHTDAVLAYLAVSAFLGDFDGYRHSHNYRIYNDPSIGKWYFLPWGIDRTFKKRLSIFDSEGVVARRCFADAWCRLEYVRTMKKVVERFESLHLDQGIDVIGAFIDDAAAADPRRHYSAQEILAARGELRAFIAERPAEVRAQLGCIDAAGAELDRDGDGFGCLDCNDADPLVHPGAAEACDGADNDCSGLVDDGAACPCPTVDSEGTTFHLCNLPMPWQDAAAFCTGQGLSLARIDSEAQSLQLHREATKRSKERWWIGLSDRAAEGSFGWHDGAPVTFAHWSRKEPDNEGCNQDCAALEADAGGKWHDTHCGQHRPFICR